jgi:hypothetical protein
MTVAVRFAAFASSASDGSASEITERKHLLQDGVALLNESLQGVGHKALLCLAFALLVGLTAFPAKADEVTKWNETATRAAFTSGLSNNPLFEVRVYTITQLAVHDAEVRET